MMHPLTEGSTVEEAGCSPLACVRETHKASYHKHLYLEVVNPKARRYYRNGSIDTLSLTLSHTLTLRESEGVSEGEGESECSTLPFEWNKHSISVDFYNRLLVSLSK